MNREWGGGSYDSYGGYGGTYGCGGGGGYRGQWDQGGYGIGGPSGPPAPGPRRTTGKGHYKGKVGDQRANVKKKTVSTQTIDQAGGLGAATVAADGGGGRGGLEDEDLCKICMDKPVDCVMLECGHMCTCVGCGKPMSECPICRRAVVRVVKTFKS